MQVLISRWGHSSAIRIPATLLKTMHLGQGDAVSLRLLDSGDIRVRPLAKSKRVPAKCEAHEHEPQVEEEW